MLISCTFGPLSSNRVALDDEVVLCFAMYRDSPLIIYRLMPEI